MHSCAHQKQMFLHPARPSETNKARQETHIEESSHHVQSNIEFVFENRNYATNNGNKTAPMIPLETRLHDYPSLRRRGRTLTLGGHSDDCEKCISAQKETTRSFRHGDDSSASNFRPTSTTGDDPRRRLILLWTPTLIYEARIPFPNPHILVPEIGLPEPTRNRNPGSRNHGLQRQFLTRNNSGRAGVADDHSARQVCSGGQIARYSGLEGERAGETARNGCRRGSAGTRLPGTEIVKLQRRFGSLGRKRIFSRIAVRNCPAEDGIATLVL